MSNGKPGGPGGFRGHRGSRGGAKGDSRGAEGADFGGPRPWDGRGGRGGRLGRLFAHGDLHLIVLFMIAEKPRHGYEVIKSIEARVNGAYSPSPGTIYPALTLLEEQGYIRVEASEGNRKLYAVTPEGAAYLKANAAAVDEMLGRMASVGAARGESPPPVVRAVENLKLALRLRLERGPLSDDAARAIAEALDRAAIEIERS